MDRTEEKSMNIDAIKKLLTEKCNFSNEEDIERFFDSYDEYMAQIDVNIPEEQRADFFNDIHKDSIRKNMKYLHIKNMMKNLVGDRIKKTNE